MDEKDDGDPLVVANLLKMFTIRFYSIFCIILSIFYFSNSRNFGNRVLSYVFRLCESLTNLNIQKSTVFKNDQ